MATSGNVFDWWNPAAWPAWPSSLPSNLVQPILPGWSFNINNNNSTAPATEAAVVARHSYGRQIGRISDALHALIIAQHQPVPKSGPIADFETMWEEVELLKSEAAGARVEQIATDLARLRRTNETEYQRLREALEQALARLPASPG